MNIEVIDGCAADLRDALTRASLPVDDLEEAGRAFFRFTDDGQPVGFGGYELYGDYALLRSLVVLPEARGHGHGRAATEALLQEASAAGARYAYLLTTSAAAFFEATGFHPIARDAAPAAILGTRQASSLCPSSAALLARPLVRGA